MPIQQLPEGRNLSLYQFSEQEQEWQPIENAQIIPKEGRVILSPPVEGTFAVMETALPPPAITLSKGLQMVSIPFKPSRAVPSEVFGLAPEAIKMACWKAEGGYAVYDPQASQQDREVAFVVPGKGYWVKFDQPVHVPKQGGLLPEEGIALPLSAGWNQIGNPFVRPLPWSVEDIYVRRNDDVKTLAQAQQAGWIEDYAWGWQQDENNPFTGRYVLVYDQNILPGVQGQLEPWKGYWVYAHQDCELILPSPSEQRTRGIAHRAKGRGQKGWSMRLQASVNGNIGETVIGIANGTRGLTIGLPPEPPEGASTVQVLVLDKGQPLAVDVKNEMRQRQEWDVLVKWDVGQRANSRGQRVEGIEEVTLSWDGVGYAPKDVSLTLVDMATGTRRYMRTQTSYRFRPSEGETERRFKVIAEIGNARPLRIVGLKAMAMRGEGVVIEFSLTKPAQVQAEVLTLTGRRVAVLGEQRNQGAGMQRLVWRGVANDGTKIPGGIFIVRVMATDEEGRQVQAVTTVRR